MVWIITRLILEIIIQCIQRLNYVEQLKLIQHYIPFYLKTHTLPLPPKKKEEKKSQTEGSYGLCYNTHCCCNESQHGTLILQMEQGRDHCHYVPHATCSKSCLFIPLNSVSLIYGKASACCVLSEPGFMDWKGVRF